MEMTSSSSSFQEKRRKLKLIAQTKVITNSELFAFILLCLLLFFLLFPMRNLQRLLLNDEGYNPELSALYLKGILKVENNPTLRLELARRYIQLNEFKEAQEQISKLENAPAGIKKEIPMLEIRILERQYYSEKNKSNIRKAFRRAVISYSNRINNEKTLSELYNISLSMGMPGVALKIADKLTKISDNKVLWNKECLKQALATSNYDKALECLNFLVDHSPQKKLKTYLERGFNLSVGVKDYDLAARYASRLLALGYEERKALEYLEFYYSSTGRYRKLIALCVSRIARARAFSEKEKYFKLAVRTALWNSDYKAAKKLIRGYGDMFLHDRKMVVFILKTAMATGDTKFSEEIADKVFLSK